MFAGEGGSTGVDDELAARGFENVGACITKQHVVE
jgi:hypothetical protein